MKELVFENDPCGMNWVEGSMEWGTVKAPDGLEVAKSSKREGDRILERYTFTNRTDKDFFTSLEDIAIYTPFNDDYTDAKTCMTKRCHTHIWCGENVSYVMALRMGGEAPHLGLVLTEGSISAYSVERDLSKISNDRGDFLLHPSPVSLAPGESFTIAWTLFSHDGRADFYQKLKQLSPNYIHVSADQYVVFRDERIHMEIESAFDFKAEDVSILCDGFAKKFIIKDGKIILDEMPGEPKESIYEIRVKNIKTHCTILVQPEAPKLMENRCRFIAQKQQYINPQSPLDGAYLIYDNEENHLFYSPRNDYNGGRERVGMGILMAAYLRRAKGQTRNNAIPKSPDEPCGRRCGDKEDFSLQMMEISLKRYMDYVERELLDKETGEVFNDCRRDNSYRRLYNYAWVSLFYLELYALYGKREDLVTAYRILKSFYRQGGAHFYAIEIPLERIVKELSAAGMEEYRKELMDDFAGHCGQILEKGTDYPAHEVNFEQSIVAPAANLLLQMYKVTGEAKYLDGAKKQMEILELFNGLQPDWHMYEVAIRHWDGYWFGKNRLYGDTYPHYWSALTANAYREMAEVTKEPAYRQRAEAAYRAVLGLFFPDGSASCAYVYPESVNGRKAHCFDPYANDQDWGLYYYLRLESGI